VEVIFDRSLKFVLLGNTKTGKTSFINKLKHNNRTPEQTTSIRTEKAKITLNSSRDCSLFSKERYRKYKLTIIDIPGDFSYRRLWRKGIKKARFTKHSTAIILFIDPSQSTQDSKSALEDVYNQFMESLNQKNPDKADEVAREKKIFLGIVINKTDLLDAVDNPKDEIEATIRKEMGDILKTIKSRLPLTVVGVYPLSVKYWIWTEVNPIFERMKRFFYQNQ